MDFCTLEVLILNSMGSQIQIGQALLMIKIQHLDMCSVWDPVQSHGPVRSNRQFLSLLQRPNTKGLLRQDVKLFGFVGCLEICRCLQ